MRFLIQLLLLEELLVEVEAIWDKINCKEITGTYGYFSTITGPSIYCNSITGTK